MEFLVFITQKHKKSTVIQIQPIGKEAAIRALDYPIREIRQQRAPFTCTGSHRFPR